MESLSAHVLTNFMKGRISTKRGKSISTENAINYVKYSKELKQKKR